MRGRVSDSLQPLRVAHIPNAPGFAGGWLPTGERYGQVGRLPYSPCNGLHSPHHTRLAARANTATPQSTDSADSTPCR